MLLLLCTTNYDVAAQGFIQNKIKSKSNLLVNSTVGVAKSNARVRVSGSKRAMKSSLKGGRPSSPYNDAPTLDELIDDTDVKNSLYNNSNKVRYVELLAEWQSMPSDAKMALEAKYRRIKDSIDNIDPGYLRVTKNIWDDSRPMVIFGWHPHWMGEIYRGYDYQLLNVVSYYSYDINPDNGAPQNPDVMNGFLAGDFVKTANDKGCSALLSITCHGEENVMRFLSNNIPAQQRFLDSILYIVDSTNADGVEINFEGVNSAVQDEFFKFVRILSTTLTSTRGDTSFVFMSVPTYDPENIYDISKLRDFVDVFIVKGYNFHQTPEKLERTPAAPLNYSTIATQADLRSTVDKYMANLGPLYSGRLVLALPYFGTKWLTDDISNDVIDMSTLSYGDIQFDYVMQKEDVYKFPEARNYYDSIRTTHVFEYVNYYAGIDTLLGDRPNRITIYYDDSTSLSRKYQFIKDSRLGGVAVHFLGSDMGFLHLNQLLSDEFTDLVLPQADILKEVNEKSSQLRHNSIYILAVLLYLSIFMAIGLCVALFNKSTRQRLFLSGRFRLLYMTFFTLLMLLIGGYLGLFKGASVPLLVGVVFGGLISWIWWKIQRKKQSLTP
jgi:spore germination protein YaaH/uncharacterized membrane protein